MSEDVETHGLAVEAADIDAAPERLAQLMEHETLWLSLASNPSLPAECLISLGNTRDSQVRRVVVQNPNTPLDMLYMLGELFPHEFLQNPLFSVLSMTQPEFVHDIPATLWLHLLRCEELPVSWLHLLQTHHSSVARSVVSDAQQHIAIAGETSELSPVSSIFDRERVVESFAHLSPEATIPLLILFPDNVSNWLERFPGHAWKELLFKGQQGLSLRKYLARYVRLSRDAMLKLAQDNSPVVRSTLAQNLYLPPEIVQQLATDQHQDVRAQIGLRPGISEKMLSQLLNDQSVAVPGTILRQRRLDEHIYTHFTRHDLYALRGAVASSPYTTQEQFTELAKDTHSFVRKCAAANPQLPLELFPVLLKDSDQDVLVGLAENPHLPPAIARSLLSCSYSAVQKRLALNANVPEKFLRYLARGQQKYIWVNLAQNPQASSDLLAQLYRDGDMQIRAHVACHPHTPEQLLVEMATIAEHQFKPALLRNPSLPDEIRTRLLDSYSSTAYFDFADPSTVFGRERIIARFVQYLQETSQTHGGMDSFWYFLLRCQDLPLPILKIFAQSTDWQTLLLLAHNPVTPAYMLEKLTHDGNRYVRAMARLALTI